jgi:hypothetical protein
MNFRHRVPGDEVGNQRRLRLDEQLYSLLFISSFGTWRHRRSSPPEET